MSIPLGRVPRALTNVPGRCWRSGTAHAAGRASYRRLQLRASGLQLVWPRPFGPFVHGPQVWVWSVTSSTSQLSRLAMLGHRSGVPVPRWATPGRKIQVRSIPLSRFSRAEERRRRVCGELRRSLHLKGLFLIVRESWLYRAGPRPRTAGAARPTGRGMGHWHCSICYEAQANLKFKLETQRWIWNSLVGDGRKRKV